MRKTALECVHRLAQHDKRVLFIGSDLGHGVLDKMKNELPDQFFMEGVSEQYIIGMAAGLAMEGFIPYLNTIGTFFIRRAYEQIAIDVALKNAPVPEVEGVTAYPKTGPPLLCSVPNTVKAPAV